MIVWYRCFITEILPKLPERSQANNRHGGLTRIRYLALHPQKGAPRGQKDFQRICAAGTAFIWHRPARRDRIGYPFPPGRPDTRWLSMASTLAKSLRGDRVSQLRLRDVCSVPP